MPKKIALLSPDVLTPWSIRRQTVPHLIRHAGYDLCKDLDTMKINTEQLPNSQNRRFERKQNGETFGFPSVSLYLKKCRRNNSMEPNTPPTQEQYKSSNNSGINTCKTISNTDSNKSKTQIAKPSSPTVQTNSPSLSPAASRHFWNIGIISQAVKHEQNPEASERSFPVNKAITLHIRRPRTSHPPPAGRPNIKMEN